jgi:hypothetical protein
MRVAPTLWFTGTARVPLPRKKAIGLSADPVLLSNTLMSGDTRGRGELHGDCGFARDTLIKVLRRHDHQLGADVGELPLYGRVLQCLDGRVMNTVHILTV